MFILGTAESRAEYLADLYETSYCVVKNSIREKNLPDEEINDSYECMSLEDFNSMKGNPKYAFFELISTHYPGEFGRKENV